MTTAQWRTLTLVLAVIFLILVAFLVVLVLGRIGDGGIGSPSTPTPIATASTPSNEPGGGSASARPSLGPSASATAGASPSAGTSPAAAVPPARAVIRGLGVDDPRSSQAKPRIMVFTSDGVGDVTVKLQKASGGKVKVCLYPGTLAKPLGDPACLKSVGGTLTGHSKSKKAFTWTVTLVGTKAGTTPMADVRIDWPVIAPRLEIIDFRLQGTSAEPYNGVDVELGARPVAGPLTLAASWTDLGLVGEFTYAYEATIIDRDTGATLDSAEGDGTNVALGASLAAGQRAEVKLLNPESSVNSEVLGRLMLSWP